VEDEEGHPGPQRALVKALEGDDAPASLRVQVGVMLDGEVVPPTMMAAARVPWRCRVSEWSSWGR